MLFMNALYFALAMALGVLAITLIEAPERKLEGRFNRALPSMGLASFVGLLFGVMFGATVTVDSPAPIAEIIVSSVPILALGVLYGRWNSGRTMLRLSLPIAIFGLAALYAFGVLRLLLGFDLHGWANVTLDQRELALRFAGLTVAPGVFFAGATLIFSVGGGNYEDPERTREQRIGFAFLAALLACLLLNR